MERTDLGVFMDPIDYASLVPAGLLDPPGVSALPGIESHLQLLYADPVGYRPLRLDLHLPRDRPSGPLPTVVYVHGGSMLAGIAAMGPWPQLVTRGVAVASISYRLAGEARYPAPVDDVRAALRWVVGAAERFGLDPTRLGLWGSSAGAYLAATAAVTRDRPDLAAVVCHYGVFSPADLASDALPGTERATERLVGAFGVLFGERDPVGVADLVGSATVSVRVPPFLLMHGDQDHRVGHNQSVRLAQALEKNGLECELDLIPGGDHGSEHFETPGAIDAVERFLRQRWNGDPR